MTRPTLSHSVRFLLILAVLVVPITDVHSDEPVAKPLAWNVFLGPWQVIGPFPKAEDGEHGLGADYLGGETAARPQGEVNYRGETYRWQGYERQVLDFDTAFDPDVDNDDVVAYAWTSFTSDRDQDAILAIGSDDGFRAWLNGEKVGENFSYRACHLDHDKVPVRLREGENVVLLKVQDAMEDWGALARLLPSGVEKPLLSFEWKRNKPVGIPQFPDLQVEFLDRNGEIQSTCRTSGYGALEWRGVLYSLYLPPPEPLPDNVRLAISAEGYEPLEQTLSWEEAQRDVVSLNLKGNLSLRGRVVDASSGRPVFDARFRYALDVLPERSDADGHFHIQGLDPSISKLVVSASGYFSILAPIELPASGPVEIPLSPGGRVLVGTITDEEGHPISGAVIRLTSGFPTIKDNTYDDGRFVLSGIAEDRDEVFPVVSHPRYSPLMHFSERLNKAGVTEVTYQLKGGAIVKGQVTAKADGRPLPGIRVVTGQDRFGSNTVNPSTRTDADGRFRISAVRPGGALVHAFSEDFAPAMKTVMVESGQETEIHFELEPGQDVTGRVTDPDGNPVESVWLITDTWSGARMFEREARSDRDGNYVLRQMPSTPVEVHVIKQGYVSKRDLIVEGGGKYDIVLRPVVKHTVTVRLADNERIPKDAEVHRGYKWPGREEIYWDRSSCGLPVWDKETATANLDMSESSNAEMFYRFRVPGYRDGVLAVPQEATCAENFKVILQPSRVTPGRVVSAETGEPMQGVTVAVVNSEERLRMDHYVNFADMTSALERFAGIRTETGSDGAFELSDLESRRDADLVLLGPEGGFHYIRGATSALVAGQLELPFPAPGRVRGRVIDAGRPVKGEHIRLSWKPAVRDEWQFPFGFGGQVTTDENGQFEFPGLGPGWYHLGKVRSFDSPGRGMMSMYLEGHELLVLPGEEITFDLIRPAGYELKGRTLDKDGQPLAGCIVRLRDSSKPRYTYEDIARSDAGGHFSFLHLAPGDYALEAEHYAQKMTSTCGPGDLDARGTGTVKVQGPTSLDLVLKPQAIGSPGQAPRGGTGLVGAIPPDFTAKLFDSEEAFTLSKHLGKVVAIDFWATWCGPCIPVLPDVQKIWETYKDSGEVVLVTVSLDQDAERLRKFLKEKELDFPVIFSGEGWESKIAQSFGVRSIPSSFVIGRDGRFATEKIHGSQLRKAIEETLVKPVDPLFAKGAEIARLVIEVGFEEDGSGVPGAELELLAKKADGSIAKEEKVPMPGLANRITWLYRKLDAGGRLEVTATAPAVPSQQRELVNPKPSEEISFQFKSPRTVRGKLTVDSGAQPAPGVAVLARSREGLVRSATSDAEGRFAIPVLPGSYHLMILGSEEFAAPTEAITVEVAEGEDPAVEEIDLARVVLIHGRVVDEAGAPVPQATVRSSSSRDSVTTDEQGRFEQLKVAATAASQIAAGSGTQYGLLDLDSADVEKEYQIELQPRSGGGAAPERLVVGAKVSGVTATLLPGGEETLVWQPEGKKDTLVVFCALWHPRGRRLLMDSAEKTKEEGIDLAAFSVDWTQAQAARHLGSLSAPPKVMYAGPGGLGITETWKHDGIAQAYLVSAEGKVLKSPEPGQLP